MLPSPSVRKRRVTPGREKPGFSKSCSVFRVARHRVRTRNAGPESTPTLGRVPSPGISIATVVDCFLTIPLCNWQLARGYFRMNDSKQVGILISELDKALSDIVTASMLIPGSELPMSKYRGLLEAAPYAMVVVRQGGEIDQLNVAAEK